jgi:hypothetical protein
LDTIAEDVFNESVVKIVMESIDGQISAARVFPKI